jgi:sodium transport system ATP-binding protein
MHEVQKLCSRVAIIHKGRVQAEGSPRELLERSGQPDLEELFFYLVDKADRHDEDGAAIAKASDAEEY